jgi:hypothetical protein
MLVSQLRKEVEGERGRAEAAEEFVKLATESLQVPWPYTLDTKYDSLNLEH